MAISESCRAYVRDLVNNHPGQLHAKLLELRARLEPVAVKDSTDPIGWQNWSDLQYVEGYLETGGAIYQDCVYRNQVRARKEKRNERKHHNG
jgi:hypothetical protein